MKEFIFLFRSEKNATENLNPGEMQEYMEKWRIWLNKFAEAGKYEDGDRLDISKAKTIRGIEKVVTDGPYIESKEVIGGYVRVKAENMEEAVEMAKGCPVLSFNGSVEIRTGYDV